MVTCGKIFQYMFSINKVQQAYKMGVEILQPAREPGEIRDIPGKYLPESIPLTASCTKEFDSKSSFFQSIDEDVFDSSSSASSSILRSRKIDSRFDVSYSSGISDLTDDSWINDINSSKLRKLRSMDEILKSISKCKPSILQKKRIYIPKYGYGHVSNVYRKLGRPTVFEVSFDSAGTHILKLSRRDGQDGECFAVCTANM